MEIKVTTKMMYGWSKYGGARMGMVRKETVWSKDWCCQVCGKTQIRDLPHYMIPFKDSDREYIQICSTCKHIAMEKGAEDHEAVMIAVRGNR